MKPEIKKQSNAPHLFIDFDLDVLENMGIVPSMNSTANKLTLWVDTKYDQEFADFLDAMPKHLTEDEKWRLSESIDASYTSIMVQRCFNKAGKLARK